MFNIKKIEESPETFDTGMAKRGFKGIKASELITLNASIKHYKLKIQEAQQKRNIIANEIAIIKREQNKDTATNVEISQHEQSEKLKKYIVKLELELSILTKQMNDSLANIPNLPALDVPDGITEEDNVQVNLYGKKPEYEFQPKQHFELGESLRMMDFEQTVKISGSRFVSLQSDLALLERALSNFMLDTHTKIFGYKEISSPYLVKEEAMFNVGQLPKFAADSFYIEEYKLRLIPTSEVFLTNLVAGLILNEAELPLRFTSYTQCFRSEAGSAGRDTRGIIRLHQFGKVELVSITKPEQSAQEHEMMLLAAEEILKQLNLHYRVMLLCAGDMGFSSKKTYDIEVWLPGQNKYREISSCSNCGDFQAIRMIAKFKELKNNKNIFVHTLNGSGLAIGRTIAAILENYQNEDGSIEIPQILRKYMGGKTKIDLHRVQ